jgi:hypothetical protein
MRRTASEALKGLELRIARLERQASNKIEGKTKEQWVNMVHLYTGVVDPRDMSDIEVTYDRKVGGVVMSDYDVSGLWTKHLIKQKPNENGQREYHVHEWTGRGYRLKESFVEA